MSPEAGARAALCVQQIGGAEDAGASGDALLWAASVLSVGLLLPRDGAVAFLSISFGIVLWSVLRRGHIRARFGSSPRRLLYPGWAIVVAINPLFRDAQMSTAAYQRGSWVVAVGVIGLLGLCASASERKRRIGLHGVLVIKLIWFCCLPVLLPTPPIDVWHLQQHASACIMRGENPYTTIWNVDIYDGKYAYGHQPFYPYAPLNLIVSLPFYLLLGDYRYGLIAALAGSAWLMRRCGARLRTDPRSIDLATLAFVLHPVWDRYITFGWLEPFLVFAFALFVYLHLRTAGGAGATLTLFCLPMLKQYVFAPLLLYLFILNQNKKILIYITLAMVVISLLMISIGAGAVFERGIFYFTKGVRFRDDSYSIYALLYKYTKIETKSMHALAAQLAFAALAGSLLRRGLFGFLLASATSMFATFLLVAPQAFVNYYLFVGSLVLLAALAGSPGQRMGEPAGALNRWIARATWGAGGASLLLGTAAWMLIFMRLCPERAPLAHRRLARGEAVLDSGMARARATDAIYLCHLSHCAGALCHKDVRCVCAPRDGMDEGEVGRRLMVMTGRPAVCTLDERSPSAQDEAGACRRGRCHAHLEGWIW